MVLRVRLPAHRCMSVSNVSWPFSYPLCSGRARQCCRSGVTDFGNPTEEIWKPSNVGFRKKAVTCEPWRISVAAAWHIWPEILVVPTYAQWPPRRHPVKGQRLTATNGPWFLHSQVEAWKGGRSQPSYTRGRRFSWRGYSEMGTRDWDRYREWYNQ